MTLGAQRTDEPLGQCAGGHGVGWQARAQPPAGHQGEGSLWQYNVKGGRWHTPVICHHAQREAVRVHRRNGEELDDAACRGGGLGISRDAHYHLGDSSAGKTDVCGS